MISCTEKGLKELIDSEKAIVVIAHTDWCCECRRVLPLLKELEAEYKVIFAEINADTVSDEYIKDFGVDVLPTVNVVALKKIHAPCVDLSSKESIKKYIETCLSSV